MRVEDEEEVARTTTTTTTVRWCQYFDVHIESFFTTFIISRRHNWFGLQQEIYKKITSSIHREKSSKHRH